MQISIQYKSYEEIQQNIAVSGDKEKLLQVMLNLLDNAIKYLPPGGTVEVGLSADGGVAHLTLADRGAGVPPEEMDKVFERFYRAANAKAVGGTGLGLAISNCACHGLVPG